MKQFITKLLLVAAGVCGLFGTIMADDQVIVFARGGDNALWQHVTEGNVSGNWERIGGSLGSAPDACSWGPGRVDVFARGEDNRLWQIYRNGTVWSGWVPHAGQIASAPTAVSWGENRIDVFALGVGRDLLHKAWNGSVWSEWVSMGGEFPAGAAPEAAARGAGNLEVVMRGMDNALWQNTWNGTGWSNWQRVGATLNSDPAVASWGGNRLDVFTLDAQRSMTQMFWDGTRWSPWFNQGGTFAVGTGPDAAAGTGNQLYVVARGMDNAVWQRRWNGSAWIDWQSLSGTFTSDASVVVVRFNPVAPLTGSFRVTMLGLKANHQTSDDLLGRDGAGDEIAVNQAVALIDSGGNFRQLIAPASVVLVNPATDDGGFVTGSGFPTETPWTLSSATRPRIPPNVLFEGNLTQNNDGLLIVPTLWEEDGAAQLETEYAEKLANNRNSLISSVRQAIIDRTASPLRSLATLGIDNLAPLGRGAFGLGDPKNRPVGMEALRDGFVFNPQTLVLTYDTARQLSQRDFGRGRGVVEIRYRETDDLLQGDYSLFVKVEETGNGNRACDVQTAEFTGTAELTTDHADSRLRGPFSPVGELRLTIEFRDCLSTVSITDFPVQQTPPIEVSPGIVNQTTISRSDSSSGTYSAATRRMSIPLTLRLENTQPAAGTSNLSVVLSTDGGSAIDSGGNLRLTGSGRIAGGILNGTTGRIVVSGRLTPAP